MNPYEHGEVFVTDDGAETDLDLGHYERFIDENLTKNSSVTMGQVYSTVIEKERKRRIPRKNSPSNTTYYKRDKRKNIQI